MRPSIPILALCCVLVLNFSCKSESKKMEDPTNTESSSEEDSSFFKLSLAQWSLHRTFNNQGVDPFRFAEISKEMGFTGVEYVNHLYAKQIKNLGFEKVIDSLAVLSKMHGMDNVLIMVDGEGDLASPNKAERDKAVDNHKKWVDAAKKLGCHSIRVNTFGSKNAQEWLPAVADGLKNLSEYAAKQDINILCENHGWLSSNAPILMDAIARVNMKNCGTLPDFGNWCIKRKDGAKWGECEEEYPDIYKGIELMLTKAKAVSAKSYNFDENGYETRLDYPKIMQMVKDSGYKGYIGVEYEGNELSEKEGIMATKDLLLKTEKSLK